MISDIVMPGMDGFELTEKAKKLRPDMLVIIMTGYTEDFSFDRAIEAGASDFIKKPFTLQELIIRIQLVELKEKLLRMSVTDELTGLYNRRGFFTLAEQQINIYNRQKQVIYLLYADLDNLKGINDTWGHLEGDHALIDSAKILKDTFRKSDIVARIGGDEFVVMPSGTTEEGTKIAVSRLQKNFEMYNKQTSRSYKLGLSYGIAYYDPQSPCSIDELLRQADKSMYKQKSLKKES
jgi:diguanylate cyclase (GGDEF)-like protein